MEVRRKYVYSFGGGTAEGNGSMRDTLGGKGAGLAEMCSAKVPVPPGFTISTEVCNIYWQHQGSIPAGIHEEMVSALRKLEERMGQGFGEVENPLFVSVRSGARVTMPGMMDAILNLGLNDDTVKSLAAKSGNARFAYDCYRRFVQMYGNVVLGIAKHDFDEIFDGQKKKAKAKVDTELTADDLKQVILGYKSLVEKKTGKPFPQEAKEQLQGARDAVFRSWFNDRARHYRKLNQIPDDWGTAVNVQAMVFGNLGVTSATGVGFTRNPATGEKAFYGEFLENAQGEDVVAGLGTPRPISELENWNPEVHSQLRDIVSMLERHYRDIQDFEFTIQDGHLYMLQTRSGKRTGPAAVRIAVEMVEEGLISSEEAVLRVDPQQLAQLLHPRISPVSRKGMPTLGRGLPASPGVAVGTLTFSADAAVQSAKVGPVILARVEYVPDDIHGMEISAGLLTSRGGMTSHAAVVARGMGTPCVAGANDLNVDTTRKELRANLDGKAVRLREGDWISLDGSTGEVFLGRAETQLPDLSSGHLARLLAWADQYRTIGVRANADTPRDGLLSRQFGADGIGLCRTEHMFTGDGRIQHTRDMILSKDEAGRRKALQKLLVLQRDDFANLFQVLDGYSVIIRLFDPPLQDYLPSRTDLRIEVEQMKLRGDPEPKIKNRLQMLRRVEELHQHNPIAGHRGCRLGISYPEIVEMQIQAILEGAIRVSGQDVRVIPGFLIPSVIDRREVEHHRRIIERVAESVFEGSGRRVDYIVGVLLEVPRCALVANTIMDVVDFLSVGTNDLTQLAFGLSREEFAKFSRDYEDQKLFASDPFTVIDREGVGRLISMAMQNGRSVHPELEIGVCGEHAADPDSVDFFVTLGVDYVSCSPSRVPIIRLAAAQSALRQPART